MGYCTLFVVIIIWQPSLKIWPIKDIHGAFFLRERPGGCSVHDVVLLYVTWSFRYGLIILSDPTPCLPPPPRLSSSLTEEPGWGDFETMCRVIELRQAESLCTPACVIYYIIECVDSDLKHVKLKILSGHRSMLHITDRGATLMLRWLIGLGGITILKWSTFYTLKSHYFTPINLKIGIGCNSNSQQNARSSIKRLIYDKSLFYYDLSCTNMRRREEAASWKSSLYVTTGGKNGARPVNITPVMAKYHLNRAPSIPV